MWYEKLASVEKTFTTEDAESHRGNATEVSVKSIPLWRSSVFSVVKVLN
jgi:hypothetical protein